MHPNKVGIGAPSLTNHWIFLIMKAEQEKVKIKVK